MCLDKIREEGEGEGVMSERTSPTPLKDQKIKSVSFGLKEALGISEEASITETRTHTRVCVCMCVCVRIREVCMCICVTANGI